LKTLDWHTSMKGLKTKVTAALRIDLEPLRDGFHPFNGPYPASTTATVSGRKLEIWHLIAFAKYGDPQAKAWLGAIKKMAKEKGVEVSPWEPVVRYLGKRKREVPGKR
jgi:hypothetical protein